MDSFGYANRCCTKSDEVQIHVELLHFPLQCIYVCGALVQAKELAAVVEQTDDARCVNGRGVVLVLGSGRSACMVDALRRRWKLCEWRMLRCDGAARTGALTSLLLPWFPCGEKMIRDGGCNRGVEARWCKDNGVTALLFSGKMVEKIEDGGVTAA
ncbi:hypothetical protein DEO72_LG10g1700 [Vigna unguiculata]|uniref:Uncharacterized protein n=1 Tax=Vigna unguiculata TaxID=3917 RepID=A0A4D6N9D8_VIGUN|nr:hypothetical protein DEO72_LG10g1700 [Vigna unguiculata]